MSADHIACVDEALRRDVAVYTMQLTQTLVRIDARLRDLEKAVEGIEQFLGLPSVPFGVIE